MPLPSYWWRQNFRGGCAQQRIETGLPSESPSLLPLEQWHGMDRFLTVQRDAATALDSVRIPHCDYADDNALTSNTAENLQLQLNKLYDYTRFKGLKLKWQNKTHAHTLTHTHTHTHKNTHTHTHTNKHTHTHTHTHGPLQQLGPYRGTDSGGNSAISTFTYDGTPLELVTEFKYLGITLTRDGSNAHSC